MLLTAPIWLLAYLPWAGLAVYLLLGRRTRAEVPFIELWRGPVKPVAADRQMHRPPLWIVLMLLASALAIAAASGPGLRRSNDTAIAEVDAPQAAIEMLSARAGQAMVRVRNATSASTTELAIQTDRGQLTRSIDLPPMGTNRDYFIDMDRGASRVRATLARLPAEAAGRSAEITRQRSWPAVVAIGELPADVRRMIDVYTARRPAGLGARRVDVIRGSTLSASEAVVVVSPTDRATSGRLEVVPHAVTQNVSPLDLPDARVGASMPVGFTAVATVAGVSVVAVRDGAVPQAWIGFESPTFSRSPGFVILLTNVFNFVGGGGDEFNTAEIHAPSKTANPTENDASGSVRSFAPWLACGAVILSAVALLAAGRAFP